MTNFFVTIPAGERAPGPAVTELTKIRPNFGLFWSFLVAKAATFGGKAFHRKLTWFIIFNFHYWRTVESCRTYHFFQVDWTKIWSIFAIISNQKFSNERVNQIKKEMWYLKVYEIKLMWSKWISEMKTLHKNHRHIILELIFGEKLHIWEDKIRHYRKRNKKEVWNL